jgi:hypothetical protein
LTIKLYAVFFLAFFASYHPAKAADKPLDIKSAYDYFQNNSYKFYGDAPYLSFNKGTSEIQVFAQAKKFRKPGAILDLKKDSDQPLGQINFTTKVCNHSPDHEKLNTNLQSVLDEQMQKLEKEVAAAVEALSKEKIPDDFFQMLKNDQKYQGSSFFLRYQVDIVYCDAQGGAGATFKLFVAQH